MERGTIVNVRRWRDHLREIDEEFGTNHYAGYADQVGTSDYGVVIRPVGFGGFTVAFADFDRTKDFAKSWLDIVSPLERLASAGATPDDEFRKLEIIAQERE